MKFGGHEIQFVKIYFLFNIFKVFCIAVHFLSIKIKSDTYCMFYYIKIMHLCRCEDMYMSGNCPDMGHQALRLLLKTVSEYPLTLLKLWSNNKKTPRAIHHKN